MLTLSSPEGLAEVTVGEAVTDDGTREIRTVDRFDIFSITKTFVAAEVLLLEEQDKLSLDDPLVEYLPAFAAGSQLTLRDLLAHRSGLVDYRDYPEFWEGFFAELDRVWTWDEAVGFASQFGLESVPGTVYSYSDTNYVILGRVVEVVTGKPLDQALQQGVLEPLQLDDTALKGEDPISYLYGEFPCTDLAETVLPLSVASEVASEYCKGDLLSVLGLPRTAASTFDSGASGMVSSLADLVRWLEALFGGDVVADIDAMVPEGSGEYGLGISSTNTPLGVAYGHLGGGAFGQAGAWYVPDRDVTIVAWASQPSDPDLGSLVNRALATLLEEHEIRSQDPQSVLAGLTDPNADEREATAQSLVGTGPAEASIENKLIALLAEDPATSVRTAAALAIGSVDRDSNSPIAIAALGAALDEDLSDEVRKAAALALGFVGTEAIPVLEESRLQQSAAVRRGIDMALARLTNLPSTG